MIGQYKIRETLSLLIEAASKKKEVLPHILFHGPSGYGKTSMALDIAKRMKKEPIQINAASIKKPENVLLVFSEIKEGDIVFLDEIHRLAEKAQECLYTVMEQFYINVIIENRNVRFIEKFDLPKFTMLAATTSSISEPLLNRFQHVLSMEPYSDIEIAQIIEDKAKNLNFTFNYKNLVPYSRNNPRSCGHLVEWLKDYCIAKSISQPDKAIEPCMYYKNLYKGGFTKDDLRYLHFLYKEKISTPLNVIASALSIDKKRIQEEIEPFLVERNLIRKFSNGRMLNYSEVNSWKSITL